MARWISSAFAVFALSAILVLSADEGMARDRHGPGRADHHRCKQFSKERLPFFGETHLHTGLSFDASLRFTRSTPREAYAFAKGEGVILGANATGLPTEVYRIDRPIDWGAVTDHSEYFGELGICTSPDMRGRFSLDCKLLLGFGYQPGVVPPAVQRQLANFGFTIIDLPTFGPASRATQMPLCTSGEGDCDTAELRVWDEMQAAADEATDQSRDCTFTAFRAYENSSTPNGSNWHRNVIFRNKKTIARPITAVDMSREENPDPRTIPPVFALPGGPSVEKLFDALQEQCLDAGTGCDVITIPHNSNLGPSIPFRPGGGPVLTPAQWHDPSDAEEAAKWRRFQPLVEMYQSKGSSECRWDPRYQSGVLTNDEDCDFELLNSTSLIASTGGGGGAEQTPANTDPRTLVRNILKAGFVLQDRFGFNPFKVGFVSATDNHNGTMGWNPEDATFHGHLGIEDVEPTRTVEASLNSSGGLGVAWAEENTRDAIFDALVRKETYATSGTRPVVRFFGGWGLETMPNLCNGNFVKKGYQHGVPMGGDLPRRPANQSPDFIVSAVFDEFIGTPLQQIQIIKGWLDPQTGETQEAVYTVAGDPNNGATVDEQCNLVGPGAESLCTVWTDPDFDPHQRAFYYVRVLENPVCRYTTRICQERFGVNILQGTETCEEQLASLPTLQRRNARSCCQEMVANDPETPPLNPVIQERAWTSPIYYTP